MTAAGVLRHSVGTLVDGATGLPPPDANALMGRDQRHRESGQSHHQQRRDQRRLNGRCGRRDARKWIAVPVGDAAAARRS
jgi:hypothetical protein